MPPCIQMVFYAHLQHSLEVTQLDLTGNWKHHHHAPVKRFIPAQMGIASLLYTAILRYQWSYLSLTIFHLKFNWTLLNTACTSGACVQVWRRHRVWELAQTVRECVPSRQWDAVSAGDVVCSAAPELSWQIAGPRCLLHAEHKPQGAWELSWKESKLGRRKSSCILLHFPRRGDLQMKYQPAPSFLHLNKP